MRIEDLEQWLGLEGFVRDEAVRDRRGAAATLACHHCRRRGLNMLAFKRPRDGVYRTVAWCPTRRCHQAREL